MWSGVCFFSLKNWNKVPQDLPLQEGLFYLIEKFIINNFTNDW